MSKLQRFPSPSGLQFLNGRSERYPAKQPTPNLRRQAPGTQQIMSDVMLALTPAILGSIYFFGLTVMPLYMVSIGTALACSMLFQLIRRQPLRFDMSAVVTGILFAMSMPATLPLWLCILGPAFGIIVGRELFGGLGRNFLNPALTGRALVRIVFAQQVLNNPVADPPFNMLPAVDGIAGATPLALAKDHLDITSTELWRAFIGDTPGKLGETSALLLLIGAGYLIWRGVIRLRIPLTMLGTIALLAWMFGGTGGLFTGTAYVVLAHLLGGATVLGAFFMVTDYGSSPSAPMAQYLYGVLLGIAIMLWRFLSPWSEGFTFAVLMVNLLVPLMDRWIRPRVVGEKRTLYRP